MSTLYARLRSDIIAAMKAQDRARATVLRTNDAGIQRAALDGNVPIDDALVVSTLRKAVKTLTAANADFAKGGRADLITANEAEIAILTDYLPRSLDGAELDSLLAEAIQATGATGKRDLGKVMGWLKQHARAGEIDLGAAGKALLAKLP
jgi:uncharacterized protein YqeY